MKKERCAGRTYDNISRLFGGCQHNGSLEYEGKMWCKTHHPPTVKAKTKAKHAKWEAEYRARKENDRRQAIERELGKMALNCMRQSCPTTVAAWVAELEEKWKQ